MTHRPEADSLGTRALPPCPACRGHHAKPWAPIEAQKGAPGLRGSAPNQPQTPADTHSRCRLGETPQPRQCDAPGTEDAGEGQPWRVSPADSQRAFPHGPGAARNRIRRRGRGGRGALAAACIRQTRTEPACRGPGPRTWPRGGADLESPAVPSETRMNLTSPNFCSSSVSGTGMKSRWENHAAHSVRSVLERGSYS